jgi:hypothetical protein
MRVVNLDGHASVRGGAALPLAALLAPRRLLGCIAFEGVAKQQRTTDEGG